VLWELEWTGCSMQPPHRELPSLDQATNSFSGRIYLFQASMGLTDQSEVLSAANAVH